MSTTAHNCPKCGARVPRTKWWLWIPLGLVGAFLAYGLSIPSHVGRAMEVRKACEAMLPPIRHGECQDIYHRVVREAESKGQPMNAPPPSAYELAERAKAKERERVAEQAELATCRNDSGVKLAEYRRLMAAGEYWPAAVSIRRCAQLQNEPKLTQLVADAEVRSLEQDIANTNASREDRIRAIETLARDYPDRGKKFKSLLAKLSSKT